MHVRVAFHHVGALREGAAFVVAGRDVGRVEAIERDGDGSGGSGALYASVAIDARVAAMLDPASDVFVASRGLIGERYLELAPPAPGRESAAPGLRDGQILAGADPPNLDRALQRGWDNLAAVRGFTTDVAPELAALRAQIDQLAALVDPASPTALPNAAELGPLAAQVGVIATQLQALRAQGLGGDAGLAQLGAAVDRAQAFAASARGSLARLDTAAAALRAGIAAAGARLDGGGSGQGVLADLGDAIDRVRDDVAKIDPLLANVAGLQQMIARGDGSLMKLANDPEFPEDAKDLGKIIKRHPWRVIARPIHP